MDFSQLIESSVQGRDGSANQIKYTFGLLYKKCNVMPVFSCHTKVNKLLHSPLCLTESCPGSVSNSPSEVLTTFLAWFYYSSSKMLTLSTSQGVACVPCIQLSRTMSSITDVKIFWPGLFLNDQKLWVPLLEPMYRSCLEITFRVGFDLYFSYLYSPRG